MEILPCKNKVCLKLLESLVKEAIRKDNNEEQQETIRAIFESIKDRFDLYEYKNSDDVSRKCAINGTKQYMKYLTEYFTEGKLSEISKYGYLFGKLKFSD